MINILKKYIQLILVIFFILIIFLINVFEIYSNLYIPALYYLKEILVLTSLFLSYRFWNNSQNYEKSSVIYILKSFVITIFIFSGLLLLKALFFRSSLYTTFFPNKAENLPALVYSTIQGGMLILLLPIILIYLRHLYSYKRKFLTPIYFNIFIILSILSSILFAVKSDSPPDILSGKWNFEDIIFKGTVVYTLFLSTRHKWITYLSKRQKYSFSMFSLIVIPILIILFDRLRVPTSAFSLSLLYFFNHLWYFVIFYGINSMVTLWLQLPTAAVFDQKLKALSSIHVASRSLNSYSSDEKFLNNILNTARSLSRSKDAWIELFPNSLQTSHKIYSLNMENEILQDFFYFSRHPKIRDEIIHTGKSVLIEDVKHHSKYYSLHEWKNNIRSLMACPLYSREKRILGILYVLHDKPYSYDSGDLELFESFSTQVSLAIENSHLLNELVAREKYKQEMKIAREVQLNLLPNTIPAFAPFQMAVETLTASEVGGDFYDIVTYKDGSKGIVLGDVSGKGTQAAFYMAEFKGIVQAVSQLCLTPRELAILTNRILYTNIERKVFITALFLKLEPTKHKIQLVRAGHTLPIHFNIQENQFVHIQSQGIGLGLNSGPLFDKTIESKTLSLKKDQFLFLYTDGLSELKHTEKKDFPFEQLLEKLKTQSKYMVNAEQLKEFILDELYAFLGDNPINDDISFIILKH